MALSSDKMLDYGEYDQYKPEETINAIENNYFEDEYDGEGRDEEKPTKIKAGALFPEDCPMDDKILKTESAIYAKSILKTISTENGTSLYDHLCTIVRQLIDERVPGNTADFIEELSAQAKLKRYGMLWKDPDSTWKELTQYFLTDADNFLKVWKNNANWYSAGNAEEDEESKQEFPNLLSTQYYLEHINVGFSKEEAYRIALSMGKFLGNRNVEDPRFWGKIFCSKQNYYVIEVAYVEKEDNDPDMWAPPRASDSNDFESLMLEEQRDSFPTLGAEETLERAGKSVTDANILSAYQTKPDDTGVSDSKPPYAVSETQLQLLRPPQLYSIGEDGEDSEYLGEGDNSKRRKSNDKKPTNDDTLLWEMYQKELMGNFPTAAQVKDPVETPAERPGSGVNRRAFYVCNDLNENWTLLPLVTPQQINGSRQIRWTLTGNLNSKIRSYPPFPGREGHYLRALLARITAGAQVSPKGFYKSTKFLNDDEEEESSETEEEDEEEEVTRQVAGNDAVIPSNNFRTPRMKILLMEGGFGWVHHTSMILPQGRAVWLSSDKKQPDSEETESDLDEDEEEGEGREFGSPKKEIALPLFTSLTQDTFPDKLSPWSVRSSSEVFTELQIAGIRSNVWPGAVAYCTKKAKMENVYIGDGLKFADRAWAPHFNVIIQMEYPEGPELRELPDPPIEIEQDWLNAIIEAEAETQRKIAASKHVESYYDDDMEDEIGTSDEEMEATTEEEG